MKNALPLTPAALLWSGSLLTATAEPLPGAAAQPSSYFYTGKPYDEDLGSYVFNYRNYSPERTRWTTADPSGFPDGANNLIYSGNASTFSFDPDGLVYSAAYNKTTRTVTLTMSIVIYGSLAAEAIATRWQTGINAAWSTTGTDRDGGGPLTVTMNSSITARPEITTYQQAAELGFDNWVAVIDSTTTDISVTATNGPGGAWVASHSGLIAAHEAGHLMGLEDLYNFPSLTLKRTSYAKFIMANAGSRQNQTPVKEEFNQVLRFKDGIFPHRLE